jgi:hypothetical protein
MFYTPYLIVVKYVLYCTYLHSMHDAVYFTHPGNPTS